MDKFLTDVHNHSKFSHDGVSKLSDMLQTAQEKGVAFYGVSEHFDYDICADSQKDEPQGIDEENYFHAARHLQEDYAGVMNVLVGAEMGFSENKDVQGRYALTYEKYRPDFVVNSVHSFRGWDYCSQKAFYTEKRALRAKKEVYEEYFTLVEKSLDAPYPYDIIGHFGYVSQYFPIEEREIVYAEFSEKIDDVLRKIIQKDKILEVNASAYGLRQISIPARDVLQRYFQLGGRKISYASDAHQTKSILRGRAEIVAMLKEIGFTHFTVPCRGEHIRVEF